MASGREHAGEPLQLVHRDELEPLLAGRWSGADAPSRTLSDPWFANLYLFRAAHDWRWLPGQWPCISGRCYDGARVLLPLFDLQGVQQEPLRRLLQGHDAFWPLSEAQAARLDPSCFELHAARDDADYLYPANNFIEYPGRALGKKRNLVRQFHAAHHVEAQPYHPALARAAREVLGGWMKARGRQPGEADEGPCLEALLLSDALGLHGFLYRVGDQPVGFVLAQMIRPGVSVMRFAKGLDDFKGIHQYMFQHYCQSLPQVRWLNFEHDLGLANFRRSKLSYQPAALLMKVRAAPRG